MVIWVAMLMYRIMVVWVIMVVWDHGDMGNHGDMNGHVIKFKIMGAMNKIDFNRLLSNTNLQLFSKNIEPFYNNRKQKCTIDLYQ